MESLGTEDPSYPSYQSAGGRRAGQGSPQRAGADGLAQEVKQICQDIQLPDATKSNISKEDIKQAIKHHHLNALKTQLTGRKLKQMADMT